MKARVDCRAIASIQDSGERHLLVRQRNLFTPLGGPIRATWFRTTDLVKKFGVGGHRGALSFELIDHMVIPEFVAWFQKRCDRNTSVREFLKPLLTETDIIDAATLKNAKERFAGFNLLPLQLEGDELWTACLFEVYDVELGSDLADKLAWKARHSKSALRFVTKKEIKALRTHGGGRIDPLAAALLEPQKRLS